MPLIDPLAAVHPDAQLADSVQVGPFCIVEADVVVGDACRLEARSTIKSGVRLGQHNYICEGAVLGGRPQSRGAGDEIGQLLIGNSNQIRENATLHCGLARGKDTIVGDDNFFMVGVHIGHDCQIGNHTIMANNTMLGGHVTVEDRAFISGNVAVHQFCRIGSLAMVGGSARVTRDIPPFVTIDGGTSLMVGLNRVGLNRAGFTREQIADIKVAYRLAFCGELPWDEMLGLLKQQFTAGPGAQFAEFLTGGTRGFVRQRRTSRARTLQLHMPEDTSAAASDLRQAG